MTLHADSATTDTTLDLNRKQPLPHEDKALHPPNEQLTSIGHLTIPLVPVCGGVACRCDDADFDILAEEVHGGLLGGLAR